MKQQLRNSFFCCVSLPGRRRCCGKFTAALRYTRATKTQLVKIRENVCVFLAAVVCEKKKNYFKLPGHVLFAKVTPRGPLLSTTQWKCWEKWWHACAKSHLVTFCITSSSFVRFHQIFHVVRHIVTQNLFYFVFAAAHRRVPAASTDMSNEHKTFDIEASNWRTFFLLTYLQIPVPMWLATAVRKYQGMRLMWWPRWIGSRSWTVTRRKWRGSDAGRSVPARRCNHHASKVRRLHHDIADLLLRLIFPLLSTCPQLIKLQPTTTACNLDFSASFHVCKKPKQNQSEAN